MSPAAFHSSWPNPTAIVVSEESNLILILKELLKSVKWKIVSSAPDPMAVLDLLERKQGGCVIINSTQNFPASQLIQRLQLSTTGSLNPILVLLNDGSKVDATVYEKIFKIKVTEKPLTQSTFIPSFRAMMKQWETPSMTGLRKLSPFFLDEKVESRLEILRKLRLDPTAYSTAIQAEMAALLEMNRPKDAELLLVEQFKLNPKSVHLVSLLGRLYMHLAMPSQAIPYINKLKSLVPESTVFNLDLAIAYLASNNFKEALKSMEEWKSVNTGNSLFDQQMSKVLCASGLVERSEQFGVAKNSARKVMDSWNEAFLTQPKATAS